MTFEEMQQRAYKYELKLWSITVSLKYMTGPWQKFLFDSEEQAREVYNRFTEELRKEKDYTVNNRDRVFTFESRNGSSTTLDLCEVSAVTINAPYEYFYEDQ